MKTYNFYLLKFYNFFDTVPKLNSYRHIKIFYTDCDYFQDFFI